MSAGALVPAGDLGGGAAVKVGRGLRALWLSLAVACLAVLAGALRPAPAAADPSSATVAAPSAVTVPAPPPPPAPRLPADAAGGAAGSVASSSGGSAAPPAPSALAQQQLQAMDTGAVAAFVDGIGSQLGSGTGFSWGSVSDFVQGKGLLRHPGRVLSALVGVFTGQLRQSLALLGRLLVLVVLAGVVRQIQGTFENEVVARIADTVVFLALGVVCLAGFTLSVHLAQSAVGDLSSFMVALLPAMIGLLVAGGSPATAGLLHPAMVAAVNAVGIVVRTVVFPLVLLSAVLDIVSALSPSFRLNSLSALMRQLSLGIMGLLFTVFLGVVAVQGAAGAVADGVALRAAKYATKTFVPVVGGMFADTAELVLTSGFLLRSGIGLVGLVTIALTMAIPVLKMMALWAVYRLAAALAPPVAGEGAAQVLGGVGGALVLLTVAVATVGLMCFLSLAVLVGAGRAAMALG